LVTLPPEEGVHAMRVLRLRAGDPVRVFDGKGHEGRGVVETAGPDVRVRLDTVDVPSIEWAVSLTVVHAVLKGDKMDDVVRDLVMMGAARIVPVVTARGEVPLDALETRARAERWRRVAVASAKQCGRAVVPRIDDGVALVPDAKWLDARGVPRPRLLLVEPGATTAARPIACVPRPEHGEASVIVGPEGGWSPDEIAGLTGSATPISLGPRTLRADVAGTVALAALSAVWNERAWAP
jgi:16S rRNA (uracil1498-N3)-methyltransferase